MQQHRASADGNPASPTSPFKRPRRPAIAYPAAILLVLLAVALLGTTTWRQQEAYAIDEAEEEQYDAVIFVTHPKTGTAAALCVVETLQLYLRRHCQHSVMTSFVNENLTGPATGYYMHLAKSVAFEQFQMIQQPYLMLRTGSAPFETCYDSLEQPNDAQALHHLPVHSARPGRVCDTECPCEGNKTQCLALGHCFSSEPFARLLWVHIIRHPVDTVLSLYNYHSGDPPAEPWLEEVAATHYASYLADNGVDRAALKGVGAFADDERSYWQFLQNSSIANGLQMEFMRSAPGIWKMARLKRRLSALPGRSIHIRYEDLVSSPIQAWAPLFAAVQTPCLEKNMSEFLSFLTKKCGPDRWSSTATGNATNTTAANATSAAEAAAGAGANGTATSGSAGGGRGLIASDHAKVGEMQGGKAGGDSSAGDASQRFSGNVKGTISEVNGSSSGSGAKGGSTGQSGSPSLSLSPSSSTLEPESAPRPPGFGAKHAAQVAALMASPYIRSQVCQLEQILGYSTYQKYCSGQTEGAAVKQ